MGSFGPWEDAAGLVAATAPTLLALYGVGLDVAGQLLATAGENPEWLRSKSAFAHLRGVAPIPASSGQTNRQRLNRGGDRGANNALWRMAMVRLRYDPATRAYRDRRAKEQKNNKDIMRCLKRYLSPRGLPSPPGRCSPQGDLTSIGTSPAWSLAPGRNRTGKVPIAGLLARHDGLASVEGCSTFTSTTASPSRRTGS